MKKLLLFLTAFWATVASGALLDVKVPQQALASPPTWTDRVVPFESAISTTLTSYRSGMGLGTEDSPTFTGLTLSGLTDTRVVLAGTAGLLGGDADLTFSGTRLTATDLTVTNFPTFSAGTATRVPFFTTAGLVTDDSDLTFATDTLTVTKGTLGGITHVANAIASANSLTSVALSPLTLGTGTFGTAVSFASATGIGTFTAAPSAPSYASTVATGTAPFTVASTTLVSNLHAAVSDATPASGITGTALAANVVTSSLTSVGALNAGSITSGFGSIDVSSNSITGGAISGTTGTFSSYGSFAGVAAPAAGTSVEIKHDGTTGEVLSYDRTGAAYTALFLRGLTVSVQANGTTAATITSTGLNSTVIGATTPAQITASELLVGAGATGGFKGAGTANFAADIYKNNTAYTNPDYVLEKWATGQIVQFADKDGAKDYLGLSPLSEVEAYARTHLHLPRFGQRAGHGLFSGSDAVLATLEEAYLHLFNQDAEVKALRLRVAALEAQNAAFEARLAKLEKP